MKLTPLTCCLVLLLPLAGCEQLGLESMQSMAKKQDTEGKAVGGACRQAGRAIEDCYTLNRKMTRAPIYEGWREMDVYMRDNKLEATPPKLDPRVQVASVSKAGDTDSSPAGKTDSSRDSVSSGGNHSRAAWSPPPPQNAALPAPRQMASARSTEMRSDSIWSSRTTAQGASPVTPSVTAAEATQTAPAETSKTTPSDKRLSELEEAARRMGLSTSVVR